MRTTEDRVVAVGSNVDPGRWQMMLENLLGRVACRFLRVETLGRFRGLLEGLLDDRRTCRGPTRTGCSTDTTRAYTNQAGAGNKLAQVSQTGGNGARTDTFAYDDAGNMTTRQTGNTNQTLTWDAEGNLAKITEGGDTTSFIYTADGDRLLRKDPTGTTLYLPHTELRLNHSNSTVTGTRHYTHGDQTIAMRTTAGVQFLAPDHQGTSHPAINSTTQALVQRRYAPFGTVRGFDENDTWPDEKGFVGGTNDPGTGLVHLGARHYDPTTGRFISVDPLINPDDSQSLNGYAYANNTPVTMSDPTGLDGPLTGNTNCYYSGKGCPSTQWDLNYHWKSLFSDLAPRHRSSSRPSGCGLAHLLLGPLGKSTSD